MVTNGKFPDTLTGRKTRIMTASRAGGGEVGTFGTLKNYFFSDNQTPVRFGKDNFTIFSAGLADNLASVGRLCESGFQVVFTKNNFTVFKSQGETSAHSVSGPANRTVPPHCVPKRKYFGLGTVTGS
jgi:hypothetical protein